MSNSDSTYTRTIDSSYCYRVCAMSAKPRLFVASSAEAKRLALAVQENLADDARVTVWSQDAFQIGENTIDELGRNLKRSDFGVFIFAPTDIVTIRERSQPAARDNVVLELGMFIGRLGKERSFIVRPKNTEMRLPSDLLGITTAVYDEYRAEEEPAAALGAACAQIGDVIRRRHRRMTRELNSLMTEALETVCRTMSTPLTSEKASLRAFIFRKEGEQLVCQHFWDPSESEEKVGTTKFQIDEATAEKVVVVRCFLDNALRRTNDGDLIEYSAVKPLPKKFTGVKGGVKASLTYVVAAPIRSEDDGVWGVVDFDASNNIGKRLLQSEKVCDAVMLRLARHLSFLLAD
jgi:Predicted nucleotide-binding protein containing TIR-like domain